MDIETLKTLEEKFKGVVDAALEEKLSKAVTPIVSAETKKLVQQMKLERSLFGVDRSGLSDEQKSEFAGKVKDIAFGKIKANEALIEEQDNRGGYLVSIEVASAILRIAASVGLVLSQAQKWPMKTDELDIPAYTGSFLEGEYLGVDTAGSLTAVTFDQARLIVKKWQLAFVVGNDLLADSSVALADWLLALGGEALANRIDKEAFIGTGIPFVGIKDHSSVAVQTMAATKTGFDKFDLAEASDAIGSIEESMLEGSCFFFHRTVWAKIRAQANSGVYVFGGFNQQMAELALPNGTALKPQGYILGYPVYTVRHLPAFSTSAISTKFGIFGNLKALAYGDKGELRVAQHQSGSFGGKEIALADQVGLVYKHRHALVVSLPAAFTVLKTAAS